MHISAYYLLQNSNFLNCIRRFIRSNECSNLTKFVWALIYIYICCVCVSVVWLCMSVFVCMCEHVSYIHYTWTWTYTCPLTNVCIPMLTYMHTLHVHICNTCTASIHTHVCTHASYMHIIRLYTCCIVYMCHILYSNTKVQWYFKINISFRH